MVPFYLRLTEEAIDNRRFASTTIHHSENIKHSKKAQTLASVIVLAVLILIVDSSVEAQIVKLCCKVWGHRFVLNLFVAL